MSDNRVSGAMVEQDVTAVLAALQTIKTKMPFLIGLSVEDRSTLPKMKDRRRSFVETAFNVMQQNPDIFPPAFDQDEYRSDKALYTQLEQIDVEFAKAYELFSDTKLALGVDLYTQSLDVKKFAHAAGKDAGLDSAVADMDRPFKRASKAAPKPPTP